MSLLKWKELAKSKTELGNKINYAHDLITQHKIGQQTSQESFSKVFKPMTTRLDKVIELNEPEVEDQPQTKKRPLKKIDPGIDYMPEVYPYEDMDVEGLIDFGDYVPPQKEKQLAPEPPKYKPSLEDIPEEPAPEYDYDEEVDYKVLDEDLEMGRLNELSLTKYQDLEEVYNDPEMATKNKLIYFQKTRKKAEVERNRLKGSKANVTKKYNKGEINEATRQERNKQIDNDRVILTDYINFNEVVINELKNQQKGSGIKGRRRKQRGGNVMFFNDVNQLLKKLELIIGEVVAGNTSIKMRNMGVNILDTLLRMSTINRPQYNKLYNQYFKVKFM